MATNNNAATAEDIAQQTLIYQKTGQLLIDSLQSAVDSFDSYQKPLLGIGLSLDSVPASIKNAALSIPVGLDDAMGTITESFQSGLFAVDKSTLTLAARMKVTGEDSRLLFKGIRSLNAVMGENTENLSTSLRETSDSFHISTTSLISVLTSLESVFEKTRTLADTDSLQKMITNFTGEVGAGQEKNVTRLFSSLIDPSIKSLKQATLLGLEDFRKSALTDPGSVNEKDLMALMPQAVKRMEDFIGDSIEMQNESANVFGDMGLSLGSLQNSLESMSAMDRASLELNTDFHNSWGTFKSNFLKPLLNWGTIITTKLMNVFNGMHSVLLNLVVIGGLILKTMITKAIAGKVKVAADAGSLIAKFLIPLGALLVPLAGILTPIIAIAAGVGLITAFLNLSKDDQDKAADEAALRDQSDKLKNSSRFSETIKNELSSIMSFIQLNGIGQLEILSNIKDAVEITGEENVAATRENRILMPRAILERVLVS